MRKYVKEPTPTFTDSQQDLYPGIIIKVITFQVTEDCCLNCSYCYQNNKTKKKMSFETAKKFIDQLLSNKIKNYTTSDMGGIVIDFIGGEPLLEIKLIRQIWEYFLNQMIKLEHPWLLHFRGSICSNGILYFSKEFQDFLQKYSPFISFTISIDGNKELHDACRIDFSGNGSYDRAISAVRHYRETYQELMGSKMTLSPENISYTYDAIINLINEGYDEIFLNCIFEKGWTWKHANILYNELIKISDYLIDNNLTDKIYISLFAESKFCPQNESDNANWCGGIESKMLAINPEGEYYECIRYMSSSLNNKQKPICLGNIEDGYLVKDEHIENYQKVINITRRSQSTDECFYCPVSTGCAWCSAYNYEEFGTVNKRATYICCMHKATALANVYYWNKIYNKYNIDKQFINYLSEEDIQLILRGGEN